ncbi:hypothetical protein GS528_17325 [Rhodococcus hoagii]|nr:hypothetical protein [Prescottella equi]
MKRVACLAIALAAALSLTAFTRETPVENMPDLLWAESFRWKALREPTSIPPLRNGSRDSRE